MSDAGLSLTDVRAGDRIPEFSVQLTVQRLIMESAANRDYSPVHHNRQIALEHGAPDMFANVMFLQAIYEATARQWMGLDGRLRSLRLQILGFNCPGDNLLCQGTVREIDMSAGEVTADLWTESGRGVTTRGTVVVALAKVPAN